MTTVDIKFYELCDEIDYWKVRTKKAEADAKYWQDEYSRHLNESIARSGKEVANALMFALSVKDDKDGNLVIDKKARKELAQYYRGNEGTQKTKKIQQYPPRDGWRRNQLKTGPDIYSRNRRDVRNKDRHFLRG